VAIPRQQTRKVVFYQQAVAVPQQVVVSEQVVAPPQYFAKNMTSNVTSGPVQNPP
jgi:hypothetical protein